MTTIQKVLQDEEAASTAETRAQENNDAKRAWHFYQTHTETGVQVGIPTLGKESDDAVRAVYSAISGSKALQRGTRHGSKKKAYPAQAQEQSQPGLQTDNEMDTRGQGWLGNDCS